jgi:hypothetical protein
MISPARAAAAIAAGGIGIFALSFVPLFLVHERIVSGEGYRTNTIGISAWSIVALPIEKVAAVLALAVGLAALVWLLRRGAVPAWLLFAGSATVLALLVACAVPANQVGHASRVTISFSWGLIGSIVLAVLMCFAASRLRRPGRRMLVATALAALVLLVGGSFGRSVALGLREGDGRHWEPGAYTRVAADGEPTETLVLTDSTYTIGDRWAGTLEWSGWTMSFDGDAACPGARGSYHGHAAGEDGLRFVAIVDTCLDGERRDDLQTGTWVRAPGP